MTGGGGFIGAHLVRLLLAQGERVKVLELDEVPVPTGAEIVRGSVDDSVVVRQAMQGVQKVYHLAAYTHLWAPDKRIFRQTNYDGTCTVLREAARAEVEVVVHTSTEAVLTGHKDWDQQDEASIMQRLRVMPGLYCHSKLLAEQAALEASRNGLAVVVVSPSLPIGPGDWGLTPPTRMIMNFLNQEVPAYLDCWLNLVDVRDVAQGHISAAERGRSGTRYLLGHENLLLSQLLQMIEEITGLAMPTRKVPYWLALAAGAVQEWIADYVTGTPPMAPLAGVRLAGRQARFASDQAVHELGLRQSPVRQALIDEIAWLVEKGHVKRSFSL